MRLRLLILILLTSIAYTHAADDYKQSAEYLALKDSMTRAFNDGDSARFFPALHRLENYLLKQDDLHAYYTQRCNEIVFQMNRQRIFEAYKLARQLAVELREKKLDKEMYMSYNMLGHLNRYCGNKETAKENFRTVIKMMEQAGYYESMPPIYMNIVNVEIDDSFEEAQELLTKALEIARRYSPERVFDIETRLAASFFNGGDIKGFLEGYKKYREGVAQGKSSVSGRQMEVYYLAATGRTDEAVALARKTLSEETHETVRLIYEHAHRWEEAYWALKQERAASDSINNVVLSNTMQGLRDQIASHEKEQEVARARTITFAIIVILLSLLIALLVYMSYTKKRHMEELERAYNHALEADKLKTAFIQNISHEMRTPLNVIAGFAQVLANPELSPDLEKRKEIASVIQRNNRLMTSQIDEMLQLALTETTNSVKKEDSVRVNSLLSDIISEYGPYAQEGVNMALDTELPEDFTIMTHQRMLHRAVSTLVDNAVKYTRMGSITIKATTKKNKLYLTVEDTGCGIPASEAERVFERFVKLNSFKEGIGLGLPLCRTIIHQLGGDIRLDTSYTRGAKFVIALRR